MTDRELENKIRAAFSRATPDVLDAVLEDCTTEQRKVIVMNETRKNRSFVKRFIGIAAAFVLIAAGVAGYAIYQVQFAADSRISLDVNPSVEIVTNAKETVLKVEPLNEDGKVIVEGLDFKGSTLDVTVNALVGSMVRNGYINELANSILISVDNDDDKKAADIQKRLSDEVAAMLKTGTFDGAVLSQTVKTDDELESLAKQYGITEGKAQLIRKILEKNPTYTFEELAPLSINELNLLSAPATKQPEQVTASGTASEKQYIGRDKALEAALTHAGVNADQITDVEIELDYDDGVMEYEVEFRVGTTEYEYEIHAVDSTVRDSNIDRDDDDRDDNKGPVNGNTGTKAPNATTASSSSNTMIGKDNAKEIALGHAGVTADAIRDYNIELDEDDGVYRYEIEFSAGGYEYEYDIDAKTGRILKNEKDRED